MQGVYNDVNDQIVRKGDMVSDDECCFNEDLNVLAHLRPIYHSILLTLP